MAEATSRIWADEVTALVSRCERGDPEAALLREMHRLLRVGPQDLCDPIAEALPSGELDRLIECGATESAALRMALKCGYHLSNGAGEMFIVTIFLIARHPAEYSFNSRSLATAMVGALAAALSDQAFL